MSRVLGKISYYSLGLVSFAAVAFIIFLVTKDNGTEVSMQHVQFSRTVIACVFIASLCCFIPGRRVVPSLADLMVILLFIWIVLNYNLISRVDASTRMLIAVNGFVLYLSARIFYSKFKYFGLFCFTLIIISGIWQAWGGLMQALGRAGSQHGLYPVTGNFFNPGPYGGFLAVVMAMSFGFLTTNYTLFNDHSRSFKELIRNIAGKPLLIIYMLCLVCFTLCFLILFLVMSRAAIIAVAVCVGCTLLLNKGFMDFLRGAFVKKKRNAYISLALLLITAVTAAGLLYHVKKDSADGRMLMLRINAKMIASNPVAGSGYGSYGGQYAKAQAEYFTQRGTEKQYRVAGAPEYAFNEYMRIGAETGVTGLVLFAGILVFSIRRGMLNRGYFWPGVMAITIFAMFSYPFSILYFVILAALLAAGSATSPDNGGKAVTAWGIALAAVLFLMGSYTLYIRDFIILKSEAVREWKQFRHLYNLEYYQSVASDYALFYPLMRDNAAFVFEYGRTLHFVSDYSRSIAILREGMAISSDPMFPNVMGNSYKAMGLWDEAEESYLYAFSVLPNRIYPLYLLMNLYLEKGDYEQAEKMCDRILLFDPKVESSATRDIKEQAGSVRYKIISGDYDFGY